MADSLLSGGTATLAELGRHVRGQAFEKHRNKCADRLLGNEHLHAECFNFVFMLPGETFSHEDFVFMLPGETFSHEDFVFMLPGET